MDNYDFNQVGSTLKSTSGSGRQRHFYDEVQLELLDAEFVRDSFPNREGRRRIAQLIGVSEKSIMWWFQNRRRRVRQLGSSRAAASTRQTGRQHRRSSPYVSPQQRDADVTSQVQSTASFYSDPPVVALLEPMNYSTSDSSSSFPHQSEWIAAANCPQEVTQSNLNYSNGFQPHQQQHQQQPENFSYYWNNWEYSPPFCSSAMTNPAHLYSNTHPFDYSSLSNYYSPETTNQFYYQSCM